MNLIGSQVLHKIYGLGNIINQTNEKVSVKFNECISIKEFQYPMCFDTYLLLKDTSLQQLIKDEIKICKNNSIIEKQKKTYTVEQKAVEYKKTKLNCKRNNIAIKCNYCNGGETEYFLGYRKPCSDELIEYNIKIAKRDWCSQADSPCNKYLNGIISRNELDEQCEDDSYVCYESQMMRNWVVMAGLNNNGIRKGEARKFREISRNMIAILTTRTVEMREEERIIFAVFLVGSAYEGDDEEEGKLTADPNYRIELNRQEAKKMKFWRYYFNPNKPDVIRMGSGLYRYITDEQALQILLDIYNIKSDKKDKEYAKKMLDYICSIKDLDLNNISLPNGALVRMGIK